MPSRSAIKRFKNSLADIGGQLVDLKAKGIPFDDMELPDFEPEPMVQNLRAESGQEDDLGFDYGTNELYIDDTDPDDADSDDTDPIGDEIDFSAFTSAQPEESFYSPEELLSNLSKELDALPADEPVAAAASDTSFDDEPFPSKPLDLDSLDNFDFPEESIPEIYSKTSDLDSADRVDLPEEAADSSPVPDQPILADAPTPADTDIRFDDDNTDSFDLPVESFSDESFPAESFTVESFPADDTSFDTDSADRFDLSDESFSDESFPAESFTAESFPADDTNFDTDSADSFDLPDESFSVESLSDESFSAESFPADDTNFDTDSTDRFDLPAESFSAESFSDESFPADDTSFDTDSIDGFGFPDEPAPTGAIADLGEFDDFVSPDELQEDFDSGSVRGAHEEFSFDGLDHILERSQKKTDAAKKAADKKAKKPQRIIPTASDDVEEIQLTDDEVENLQETLSRYPLNLRMACEEIIAEHVVNPKQMSDLIEHLVWGASAKETALLASKILGKTIFVPKAFEKSSGAELEAEQASFAYIFVHNFLPMLRLFMFIAVVAASSLYLIYKFIYIPLKAESIYKIGYERIFAGEYQRANQRFTEAFNTHRKKDWFYKYAEAFRDERQYIYAEQKYDELLRYYTRDKKGVLDYAELQTYYLRNYAKADTILRHQLLDYAPNDKEGLLAAGDNHLMWGEIDPSKYEEARFHYARLLEKYGWKAPVVERMMRYFIRTDNLKETLYLKNWFDNHPKWKLSAASLGELGGYLLDKKLEEVRGVPNEYVEHIHGVRDLLLEAVYTDPSLPEPHYHLARYYNNLGNAHEERVTLRIAVNAFDNASEESIRRLHYRIDTHQRYADALINAREFLPAEEQLVRGINLYEDAVSRRLISRSPQYGRLYAGLGDLEYFTKTGDMSAALRYYHRSEQNGWVPPEMQYRMGSAYYQLGEWRNALEYLFTASSSLPLNRRVLFAMGNAALKRGNYFAALGYYNRLLDILESQRSRLPVLLPNDRPEYLELAERLMMARNNAGVACEMLAAQTGDRSYQTRALAFYAEAERAWDARTRDPRSMLRSGSTPLPHLNARNALYPQANYEPQIFIRIDREASESSPWETLAPLARLDYGRTN
ncbi:MAG: tetratricopeptide repeat protein [Treponema sp.]|nr:tetratricopeptide repeat protein [Treponema sp.]